MTLRYPVYTIYLHFVAGILPLNGEMRAQQMSWRKKVIAVPMFAF